jgi:putative DNA primase/helicase
LPPRHHHNVDPQLERPELREFSSNPVATVLADRGAYIAACLAICRAYIVAGRPAPARKLASFEGWSDTVRSALIWLGKADCIDSMETSREEDPERNELSAMLRAWSETIGMGYEHRSTLAGVIEIANGMEPPGYNQEAAKDPDLLAAIQAVAT